MEGSRASHGNVAELVRASAAWRSHSPALYCGEQLVSWSELDRSVDAVAVGLRSRGVAPGDRVALLVGNTVEFVATYFGVLRAGAVAVPVNPGSTSREIAHVLGDSAAALVVTGPEALAALREAAPDAGVVVVGADPLPGETAYADLTSAAPEPVPSAACDEDLAVLLYTAGTSGRPKGAMLPHRALLANLNSCARLPIAPMTAEDVVLLALPLFHVYGLNAALGMLARTGACGVLVPRFDPVGTLELIRERGVTNVPGAPPMYVAWSLLPDLGAAFAGVRLAVSGSAPLPRAVASAVERATGRPIVEGYGLTEAAPVVTSALAAPAVKPGSVGRPVPGVSLRLVDATGADVEPGDPGELLVRGPNLFVGYWPDRSGGPDPRGWFATGDVGYLDDDGDLFLVDRLREVIMVSGFNVYPREVEDVLLGHPDVEEVAVVGVPHPYTGESVKALVVASEGASPTADELITYCARRLARFKCPTSVQFVSGLPKSSIGKIAKGRLRETGAGA